MKARKMFFMDCHLAGRMYHDADEVWDELKVGTQLQLVLDTENRYDPKAVAVLYNKQGEEEPYLLGYIPRGRNSEIACFLESGWTNVFSCRIRRITPDAHPENQVQLTISVNRNPEAQ